VLLYGSVGVLARNLKFRRRRRVCFLLLVLESYPLLQPLLFFRDWRDDNVTIEKKIIFV